MPIANQSSNDSIKRAVGYAAADLVEEGMCVGLGTGSTAFFLVERLGQRCQEGLKITAFPTSRRTEEQAKNLRIPLIEDAELIALDLAIDGADEIDPKKRMIKGGGGALLREKLVATAATEMVVIIGEDKQVEKLGKFPLPVEICRFAYLSTVQKIKKLGYPGSIRKNEKGDLFITDEGHFIFDIQLPQLTDNPEDIHTKLLSLPGVVETGFFIGIAGRVLIGKRDGTVEILP